MMLTMVVIQVWKITCILPVVGEKKDGGKRLRDKIWKIRKCDRDRKLGGAGFKEVVLVPLLSKGGQGEQQMDATWGKRVA
jgi:hypothetical protein